MPATCFARWPAGAGRNQQKTSQRLIFCWFCGPVSVGGLEGISSGFDGAGDPVPVSVELFPR